MTNTSGGDQLALDTREGLPDSLRTLLTNYPREAWQADPGFSELIRFWLDRHVMFRRLLERLKADTEAALDGTAPGPLARPVARFGGLFFNELHGHHHIEDTHYFPILSRRDARLAEGFRLLDRDHHALDGILNTFAEGANAVIRAEAPAARDAAGRYLETLSDTERMLDRHLEDEEHLIVPVLLRYGEAGLV